MGHRWEILYSSRKKSRCHINSDNPPNGPSNSGTIGLMSSTDLKLMPDSLLLLIWFGMKYSRIVQCVSILFPELTPVLSCWSDFNIQVTTLIEIAPTFGITPYYYFPHGVSVSCLSVCVHTGVILFFFSHWRMTQSLGLGICRWTSLRLPACLPRLWNFPICISQHCLKGQN